MENRKRFILEFGSGLDQHGQDPTSACVKAVKDAVSHACLAGLVEIVRLKDVEDMQVEIQIACPYPEKVDRQAVLAAVPFGKKHIHIEPGGLVAHGLFQPELGDLTDEALVANAAITVWIDPARMLAAWKEELQIGGI